MSKCAFLLLVALTVPGCPDINQGDDSTDYGPIVEFDPSNRIVPFPNNLLLNAETGKVNLPAQCNETPTSTATRELVLNHLDGFGAYETAMTVTFSDMVDPASLEGNVLLYKRVDGVTSAVPVPVRATVGTTTRFDAECANPATVVQALLTPLQPLEQRSTYVVALKQGIKTASGAPFQPSFTWLLVRETANPVTFDEAGNVVSDRTPLDPTNPAHLERLRGIDLLWRAHAQGLAFLAANGTPHGEVLLAWEFRTQTTTDPLDPAIPGSPAALVKDTGPLRDPLGTDASVPVPQGPSGEQFLFGVLPGRCQNDPVSPGPLECQAVSAVMFGGLMAQQFQVGKPNAFDPTKPIPGAWSDPTTPTATSTEVIRVVIAVPTNACATSANGCPTVVFGHAFNSSATTVLGMAAQLASRGFNAVAIDAVAHGTRARRISDTGDCAGTIAQSTHSQCFSPFLSPDLGATRDNMRQSVVDVHSLVAALKACGTTSCGLLKVNRFRIGYIGMSLGGFMGGISAATIPDFRAAVLNTGGVGWADFIENTDSAAVRCVVVDGLIDAGILVGEKSSAGAGALCAGSEWKQQPGFRTFAAIGRWVLDPADTASFARMLSSRKVLLQEIVNDGVIPNVTTANAGNFLGLIAQEADMAASTTLDPSTAVGSASSWVRYATLPADGGFPGNTFEHPSLLQPSAGTAGTLGTARLQTDAIGFLVLNP